MGEGLKRRIKQKEFANPAQEAMLNLIVAAGHVRNLLEQRCQEFGISQPQYNVLRILRGAYPQGYPRCEVIQRMVERAPDVTRLIDRLEQQGLVRRERSPYDRRLSITRITEQGLELLDRMQPSISDVHDYVKDRLSERECGDLSRLCELLYADSDSVHRNGNARSSASK